MTTRALHVGLPLIGNTLKDPLAEDLQVFNINRMRKRRRLRNIFKNPSARFGDPAGGDPFFNNVLFLMDWEDSATLLSNPNLGSWVGTPSYSTMLIETGTPLMGNQSVITNSLTDAMIFSTWDPADGEWTVEWSSMYNGVTWPGSSGSGNQHDLVTMYNATFSNRAFIVVLQGDGAGSHLVRVILSEDGINNDVVAVINLGQDLSHDNSTVYHWALERHGDNLNLYLASSAPGSTEFSGSYTLMGTAALTAGYDIFTSGEQFRVGTRESGGVNTPSGRHDNVRLTDGIARFQGVSSPALSLPFQRSAS